MNVVFLDYDGVVNTPMWNPEGTHCRYNFPEDNKVNNFQCVQWVSEFCQKYDYKIVVSSTWRLDENYIECLKNGGLRSGVDVIGRTPSLVDKSRGEEIQLFLDSNPDIENFLIFDDENDMDNLEYHLVLCDTTRGFGLNEFHYAERLHKRFINRKLIN